MISIIILSICLVNVVSSLSLNKNATFSPERPLQTDQIANLDIIHPQLVSIEHLQALLQRATQLFQPVRFHQTEPLANSDQQINVPQQYMQPPSSNPYSFYMPLYEHDNEDKILNTKLDERSRKLQKLIPPSAAIIIQQDFAKSNYATKAKKSPKKFDSNLKHINVKWLNSYEKQFSSPDNKKAMTVPKAVYLLNDERNRINFDDSFFGVNTTVKEIDNKMKKGSPDQLNQGHQLEEDLLATSTFQLAKIKRDEKTIIARRI
uniref:Uncharacterized protein n=1 Tax=Glossina austeni TaxID=7395 RepID=A0A1A9UFA8_GLOAU